LIDVLTRPKALRGLIALRAAEPDHLTATAFMEAAGYSDEKMAAELRDELKAAQLVSADTTTRPIPVRLTERGRDVADLAAQIDTHAPGVIDRSRALAALVALRDVDPDAMTPGQFRKSVRYGVLAGVALREDLARMGLVGVEETLEGRVRVVRIRLTEIGRAVADRARRMRKLIENTKDSARKGRA
jgi:hypothetical protein